MLKFEKRHGGNSKQWCRYCNVFVANNPKCINDHNNCVTHKVNVQKYESARKKEVMEEKRSERVVDAQIEEIRAKASAAERGVDVTKKSELEEEFEMARQLYGDELLKELTEPKEKVNKVQAYNAIMKSLPTKIPKKHRTPVRALK